MMNSPYFDYAKQAWVVNGRYERCGHPVKFVCDCYGRKHEGELADTAVLVAAEHEEILAGLGNERPHSRIRTSDGRAVQWTYGVSDWIVTVKKADGSLKEIPLSGGTYVGAVKYGMEYAAMYRAQLVSTTRNPFAIQ